MPSHPWGAPDRYANYTKVESILSGLAKCKGSPRADRKTEAGGPHVKALCRQETEARASALLESVPSPAVKAVGRERRQRRPRVRPSGALGGTTLPGGRAGPNTPGANT